jgi:hypothetical protein
MTTIKGGPLKGAILRKAYDPSIVSRDSHILIAFECTILNGKNFRVDGTSACVVPFNERTMAVDLDRVNVVVTGAHTESASNGGSQFHSASVPQIVQFQKELYLYWSEVTASRNSFSRIVVRGMQLDEDEGGIVWGKAARSAVSTLDPRTTVVWRPVPGDPFSDTAVDIKSVWTHGDEIIALAGLGGSGCAAPGSQAGCFRMAIAKASRPLGEAIFNASRHLHEDLLPTNPQDYTRPIRDPEGGYSFVGTFFKPTQNGLSELRPVPSDWSGLHSNYELVIFPFPDHALWPKP